MLDKAKQRQLMLFQLKNARKLLNELDVFMLPQELVQLQNLLMNSDFPDLQDVLELVSQNETLAGRVVELANSLMFDATEPVQTIRDAVRRLGLNRLKNVVLSMTMQDSMNEVSCQDITTHNLEVARVCAELARHCETVSVDEAYLLGLFHNVGALMMAAKYPDYENDFFSSLTMPVSSYRKEESKYKTTHGYLGVAVAERWGLNDEAKKVMLMHHRGDLKTIHDERIRVLVAMIQLANGIVSEMMFGTYVSTELKNMMESAQEVLLLSNECVSDIRISLLTGGLGD